MTTSLAPFLGLSLACAALVVLAPPAAGSPDDWGPITTLTAGHPLFLTPTASGHVVMSILNSPGPRYTVRQPGSYEWAPIRFLNRPPHSFKEITPVLLPSDQVAVFWLEETRSPQSAWTWG